MADAGVRIGVLNLEMPNTEGDPSDDGYRDTLCFRSQSDRKHDMNCIIYKTTTL